MNRSLASAVCGAFLLGGCLVDWQFPPTTAGTTGGMVLPGCPANSSRDEDGGCFCWTYYEACVLDAGGALLCANVHTDPLNCGFCGNVCPAEMQCLAGRCECQPSCEMDGGLTCVDTYTDSLNCGRCGNACPDGQERTLGICTCVPSLTIAQCDTDAGLTCVDLAKNPDGCGPLPCSCPDSPPFDCCPGLGCTDISDDPFNCGSCGNVCDSGVCLTTDAGKGVCE